MNKENIMDKFGIYFDEIGLSKTYGRLFGFFMTTNEPVSMTQLVEKLQISKSTASVEIRRLLSMGAIEKVLLSDSRADFYQLKKNIWEQNLKQKIRDVKKLQSIIEEIPQNQLETLNHLKEMANYCVFIKSEMESIVTKYNKICTKIHSFSGDWSATLDLEIAQFTMLINLKEDESGNWRGTFDYLEGKIFGLQLDSLLIQGTTLKFEIKSFLVKFEGNLINHSQISGQWSQHGKLFPLIFEKGKKIIEAPKRPQEPTIPYQYKEEIVSFESQEAELSGTLTLPFSQGPFPTVILIAGAGPCDRDATVLGHKPFFVLADYLTRHGIAVLRFDKRGCGKSTGNFNIATTEDFVTDVQAAIVYLQSRNDVSKIGLMGFSEGGIIAPMVSQQSDNVDFMILMAACAVTGEEMMMAWSESLEKDKGSSAEAIEKDRQHKKEMFTVLKEEPNFDIAANKLRALIIHSTMSTEKQQNLTSFESEALDAEVNYMNTHWFRYFLKLDPCFFLKKTQIPVLALHGELDKQVLPKQNLPLISECLKQAGNKNYQTIELPKLNHIFQTCQDGSFAEYAKIEETISPTVLRLVTDWILKTTTL